MITIEDASEYFGVPGPTGARSVLRSSEALGDELLTMNLGNGMFWRCNDGVQELAEVSPVMVSWICAGALDEVAGAWAEALDEVAGALDEVSPMNDSVRARLLLLCCSNSWLRLCRS
jgi:hypothetical protein